MTIARYLAAAGELTEVPSRAPGRGPPYWKSRVLRLQALGDDSDGGNHSNKGEGCEPRKFWCVGRPSEATPGHAYGRPKCSPTARGRGN